MDAPVWLDNQMISSVLQDDLKTDVNVSKMSVKPAVPPGNNYLSDIFRVTVEFTVKNSITPITKSLIVKAPGARDIKEEVPEEFEFYTKEPKIYKDLLPKMVEKVVCDFGPKFYPCKVETAVILQDLKEEGYLMKSRFDQLDFDHCSEVYKTLAKFHASSIASMKENPGLKSLGIGPPMDEDDPMVRRMKLGVSYCAKRVVEITKDMEECKGFSEYLLTRVDHLWENMKSMFAFKEGKFNVMLHGDLWTTNVMFKHDDNGNVERVKLLDYQLTRVGSPVADLNLFFWTSGNFEVRERHQKELNNMYLTTLNSTLEKLRCNERYSPVEFQLDMKESADTILSLIVDHLAVLIANPADGVFRLDELDPETESGRQLLDRLLDGKYYRKVLPDIARQYLSWLSS